MHRIMFIYKIYAKVYLCQMQDIVVFITKLIQITATKTNSELTVTITKTITKTRSLDPPKLNPE